MDDLSRIQAELALGLLRIQGEMQEMRWKSYQSQLMSAGYSGGAVFLTLGFCDLGPI